METLKTIVDAFPRCRFNAENTEIASIGIVESRRVAREERAVEADVKFPYFVPYKKLFSLEKEITDAYALNYVKIYPRYDKSLFNEKCIADILYEAQKTDAVSHSFLPNSNFTVSGNLLTINLHVGQGAVSFVERVNMGKRISSIILREFGIKVDVEFTQSEQADIEFDEMIQKEISAFYTSFEPPAENKQHIAAPDAKTNAGYGESVFEKESNKKARFTQIGRAHV